MTLYQITKTKDFFSIGVFDDTKSTLSNTWQSPSKHQQISKIILSRVIQDLRTNKIGFTQKLFFGQVLWNGFAGCHPEHVLYEVLSTDQLCYWVLDLWEVRGGGIGREREIKRDRDRGIERERDRIKGRKVERQSERERGREVERGREGDKQSDDVNESEHVECVITWLEESVTGPKWRKRKNIYYDAFAVMEILDDEILFRD